MKEFSLVPLHSFKFNELCMQSIITSHATDVSNDTSDSRK